MRFFNENNNLKRLLSLIITTLLILMPFYTFVQSNGTLAVQDYNSAYADALTDLIWNNWDSSFFSSITIDTDENTIKLDDNTEQLLTQPVCEEAIPIRDVLKIQGIKKCIN